jgi:hypothetical protein
MGCCFDCGHQKAISPSRGYCRELKIMVDFTQISCDRFADACALMHKIKKNSEFTNKLQKRYDHG